MSLFLPPRTSPNAAIAICGRCRMKKYATDLKSDPNVPGLRVCSGCADVLDPYRMAPRQPENIVINYPRLDEPLTVPEE